MSAELADYRRNHVLLVDLTRRRHALGTLRRALAPGTLAKVDRQIEEVEDSIVVAEMEDRGGPKFAGHNLRRAQKGGVMSEQVCCECGQPATFRQVGRCVYAEPCGHRYQFRIEAAAPLREIVQAAQNRIDQRRLARYRTEIDPKTGIRRIVKRP